jgi:hypothetical protein
MRRQCAWCNRYLGGSAKSGALVTHGICNRCSDCLRRSMPYAFRQRRLEEMLLAMKATLVRVFHVRATRVTPLTASEKTVVQDLVPPR